MKMIALSGGVLLVATLGLLLGIGSPWRTLCIWMCWGAGFALLISVLRYLVVGK